MNIDTLYSDTATITVMEIIAISLDLLLAASATMNQALFWNSLLLSLTVGLIAAYPRNSGDSIPINRKSVD